MKGDPYEATSIFPCVTARSASKAYLNCAIVEFNINDYNELVFVVSKKLVRVSYMDGSPVQVA